MRALRSNLPLLLLAGCLFLGLVFFMRSLERSALHASAINDQLTPEGQPRPLADVARAVRELKLVTIAFETTVSSAAADLSWRGDVNATVNAPVRLLYGVDLSSLEVSSLAFSPIAAAYIVKIPPPERIATEVQTEDTLDVDVGWGRLRTRAGEYYLGLARRDLYERARHLALSEADARTVRQSAREQVHALMKKIVGDRASITVSFTDGAP